MVARLTDGQPPELVARRNAAGLAEIDCPYCFKRHRHGWGSGHRVSHCSDLLLPGGEWIKPPPNPGYVLICED